MEISKTEFDAVQEVLVDRSAAESLKVLAELELAFVGGGAGDVVFA